MQRHVSRGTQGHGKESIPKDKSSSIRGGICDSAVVTIRARQLSASSLCGGCQQNKTQKRTEIIMGTMLSIGDKLQVPLFAAALLSEETRLE
jgi:hypothetical protein